ncbi:LPS export ABC transporter permease LptF [Azomonas macrocytogenes]|uniref:Lipopolysaccharide export system permease protein LptF n=1 Tax=Azomonas macrocytogenes TaxID=69962 RepID=A0A839SX15_AZOMA|nr:LPS export ABC transporter permease LptF [Azomonas macrocytogenes]MBB3101917.1 lipopolysaccharide export system permease protein [Azomonas macrocytogenes]
MIIFRYLSRELLITLGAVSAVLLLIIMSGRFIKYLAQAAQGILDPGVLFTIIGFRMPGFLQLILPLGLFLGILLTYGRLYLESEMTVLSATGMSQHRLLAYSMGPALIVALAVACLSLWLSPKGLAEVERILNEQDSLTEFDTLVPGRFQTLKDGTRVTYTQDLSSDRSQLQGVFISETVVSQQDGKARGLAVLVADGGRQLIQPDGSRYLILEHGFRYDGRPGQADYRVVQYDTYGVQLARPNVVIEVGEMESIPTGQLFGNPDRRYQSELQWRLSLPVLVFIVTLLAVPLSKVNPRQGRYLKLLPAILLYMAYLASLIAVRGALNKGKLPLSLGFWWVHLLFLSIGLILFYWESIRWRFGQRRVVKKELING